jgi:hypothetical protein
MAWTQSDLDRIDAAIASGVRKVTFADGRQTEYHDLNAMMAARRVVATQLKMAAESTSGAIRRRFAAYRSGV